MPENAAAPSVEMTGISKAFPGVRALDGVSFSVGPGEVHALLGKNGAGKSTLMHVLKGLLQPDSGEIRIRDRRYSSLTPAESAAAGIALVAQHSKYVPGLSIAENVFMGALPCGSSGFVDWKAIYRLAEERLASFGLDLDVKKRMEATTVAERQMIEIARALLADASVIILDEPTAPLPKHEVNQLFRFVHAQKKGGSAFIYISHYLEEIFEIADRVTVLRNGRLAGAAAVKDVTQPDLIRMISGANVERFSRKAASIGAPVLKIDGLTRPGVYEDVHLSLHAGEVVGLTGLEGSGPGGLARGLFGLEPMGAGKVSIDAKPYSAASPSQALAQRVAYLPRDRHGLGIVASRSVKDNATLSVLAKLQASLGLLNGRKERALVQSYIDLLGIKTPSMNTAIETLSGGNQQKVVVAKLAATHPRVLLLDEPTQGVDVQAKVEILRIVDDLSKQGVAVGVVSDELNELMEICDRIVVFYRGRVLREFVKGKHEMTAERLLAAIEGDRGET